MALLCCTSVCDHELEYSVCQLSYLNLGILLLDCLRSGESLLRGLCPVFDRKFVMRNVGLILACGWPRMTFSDGCQI